MITIILHPRSSAIYAVLGFRFHADLNRVALFPSSHAIPSCRTCLSFVKCQYSLKAIGCVNRTLLFTDAHYDIANPFLCDVTIRSRNAQRRVTLSKQKQRPDLRHSEKGEKK